MDRKENGYNHLPRSRATAPATQRAGYREVVFGRAALFWSACCIGVFYVVDPATFVLGRFAEAGTAGRAFVRTVTYLFLLSMVTIDDACVRSAEPPRRAKD